MNNPNQEVNRVMHPQADFNMTYRPSRILERVPIKSVTAMILLTLWLVLSYSYDQMHWRETLTACSIIGGLLLIRGFSGPKS
jgi:hypothetical protein